MKLVIVESPHKCETIGKYLGKQYNVMASVGHLNDLAINGKGGFGVDVENGFKATYVIDKLKYKTVNLLKEAVKNSTEVILATDPDREGEAIAWHLTQILKLDALTTKRLEFHEITKESINYAIENPRTIDMNLFHAQEVRRIMDRIIGFKLSEIIQKKIKARSAGRVQSATLKLIADHDTEIDSFVPEEYWTLSLDLSKENTKLTVYFDHSQIEKIANKEENDKILARLDKTAKIVDIKKTIHTVESKPPFTTSTLQQEAFNVLHMPTAITTRVAQHLYEGLNIGSEHVGLVTYIRTDNVALSDTFVKKAKTFIENVYGKEYVGHRKISKVNGAQNAHEAIRPTSLSRTPSSLKEYLKPEEYKLYKLIYERTVASLMKGKVDEVTSLSFVCGDISFKCEGSKPLFDGYTKIYLFDDDNEKKSVIPSLNIGDEFNVDKVNNSKEFTKAPAHYNEAKIVKLMEEKGIGRPSTYAATIKTLKNHGYIESEKGIIKTTEIGRKTSFVLNKYFPKLVDAKYTASMEKELDKVQEGKILREKALEDFYYPFIKEVDDANKIMYSDKDEPTGEMCPVCGAPLVYKKSRYGGFIGCSNFPMCDYRKVEKVFEYAEGLCPKCGKPLVYRYTKNNKKFVGCSGYPECDYIQDDNKPQTKVVVKKCPDCGGDLIIRTKKGKKFLGCSNFPKCTHLEQYKENSIKK